MVDTYMIDMDMFLNSTFMVVVIASLIISILLIVSYYKLFKKNGEKGWKAIIPIYNIYTLMKIAGMNPLSIFLLIIPIVNLFVMALLSVELANKYNRSALFAIGLLFFPFICYPILAFSKVGLEEYTVDGSEDILETANEKEKDTIETIEEGENTYVDETPSSEETKEENKEKKEIEEVEKIDSIENMLETSSPDRKLKEEKVPSKNKISREASSAFKEILKVNDYNKEKEEVPQVPKQTKPLNEILKVNHFSDTENNTSIKKEEVTPPEKSRDLNAEVDRLLKIMDKRNKEEEAREEKEEALRDSSICESCGSVVPRFAKKCLLCGSDKRRK